MLQFDVRRGGFTLGLPKQTIHYRDTDHMEVLFANPLH